MWSPLFYCQEQPGFLRFFFSTLHLSRVEILQEICRRPIAQSVTMKKRLFLNAQTTHVTINYVIHVSGKRLKTAVVQMAHAVNSVKLRVPWI